MSYDLYLALPETRIPKPKQLGFADIATDWPLMYDPFALMTNERIINELLASSSEFAMYSVYFEELPGRMFEIGHENGAMIKLIPDRASFRLPYWYRGSVEARIEFKRMSGWIDIIQTISGYGIYDPQLEAEIDFARDFDRIIAFYLAKMESIGDAFESPWGDWPPSYTL